MQLIKSIDHNIPLKSWLAIFDYRDKGYGLSTRTEYFKIKKSLTSWKEWFKDRHDIDI